MKETEGGEEETVGRWCEATQTVLFYNESAERAHRRHDDYRPAKKQRSGTDALRIPTSDDTSTTDSGTGTSRL